MLFGANMKNQEYELKEMAEKSIRLCLEKVPFISIQEVTKKFDRDTIEMDLWVKLTFPGGQQDITVEIRNNGQPRLARAAANQLLRYNKYIPNAYGIFIAPYISEKAAQICQKEGIGYIDFEGNCLLSFRNVYIEHRGAPDRKIVRRELRSLYTSKAQRVLRVFLNNTAKTWKTKDLALEADVSIGQVSNVMQKLKDREWVKQTSEGVKLATSKALLKEWSENYTYKRSKAIQYFSLKSVSEIENDIAEICKSNNINYALTGFSGAARFAPAVRYQRVMSYIEDINPDLTLQLGLKEVSSGANVMLMYPYDEGVFYGCKEIDGVRIVSPVQLYLDLKGITGRGEEAAEVIMNEVLTEE
jgi:hypothetical protein